MGTVSFVFSDIEGSTQLLTRLGDEAYAGVLAQHHEIIRGVLAQRGGTEVDTQGDAFFAVFEDAANAVEAAAEVQRGMGSAGWPAGVDLRVRMGIHTGRPTRGRDGYVGVAVHQASRICGVAHGGQVVVSSATRDAATHGATDATAFDALGRHRLKDLGPPIELFQVRAAGLAEEFPPLRSLDRVLHNLPLQPSTFLGRAADLITGAQRLHSTRVLTITGAGGTGKTRLSFQLAANALEQFPDGVWVAELSPLGDAALVAETLAAGIGVRVSPGSTATEAVVDELRHRRALVVLDNCEHVVDEAAALVDELVRTCADVRVVATSREPLRVDGETVWALDPLGVASPSDADLSALLDSDAVALFCARAAEADETFVLSDANAPDVVALCRRLDGMPLALELAAARSRSMSPAELNARLATSFDLLDKGRRGAEPRQSSLRGAIAWSYDLLSPAERAVLARLSVFAGSWTLEAAERVAGDDGGTNAADVLYALVDKSLVIKTRTAESTRFRMLDAIRAFAAERLRASSDANTTAERHARWFAAFGQRAVRELTAEDPAAIFAELEESQNDLITALDVLGAAGEIDERARLACDLVRFWDARGLWRVRRQQLQLALHDDLEPGRRALVLGELAAAVLGLGDYEDAQRLYVEALAIAASLADPKLESEILGGLGTTALAQGEYLIAREHFQRALEVAIAAELAGRATWAGSLGHVSAALGDYTDARGRYREALASTQRDGDREGQALWLGNLGLIDLRAGDFPSARRHLEDARTISSDCGDRPTTTRLAGNLGYVAEAAGNYAEARDHFAAALAGATEIGDPRAESTWIGALAATDWRIGDYDSARRHFGIALAKSRSLGDRRSTVFILGNLGAVCGAVDDLAAAREHYEEAWSIARAIGVRPSEGHCAGGIAYIELAEGNAARALTLYSEALDIAREVGERDVEGDWLVGLADASLATGDSAAAAELLSAALEVIGEVGTEGTEVLELCGALLATLGDAETAAGLLACADKLCRVRNESRPARRAAEFAAAREQCRAGSGASEFENASATGATWTWSEAAAAAARAIEGVAAAS